MRANYRTKAALLHLKGGRFVDTRHRGQRKSDAEFGTCAFTPHFAYRRFRTPFLPGSGSDILNNIAGAFFSEIRMGKAIKIPPFDPPCNPPIVYYTTFHQSTIRRSTLSILFIYHFTWIGETFHS